MQYYILCKHTNTLTYLHTSINDLDHRGLPLPTVNKVDYMLVVMCQQLHHTYMFFLSCNCTHFLQLLMVLYCEVRVLWTNKHVNRNMQTNKHNKNFNIREHSYSLILYPISQPNKRAPGKLEIAITTRVSTNTFFNRFALIYCDVFVELSYSKPQLVCIVPHHIFIHQKDLNIN